MAQIISSGIGSGLDISGLVNQLVAAERAPVENRLNTREALYQARLSAYGTLKSSLSNFQDSLARLQDANLYSRRTATSSDTSIFTAAADAGAAAGSYSIEVEQLAEAQKVGTLAGYQNADTFGEGSLTFTLQNSSSDTFSIDVSASDSLVDIRDAINNAEDNVGVQASIVSDENGGHLVLISTSTGVENAFAVTSATTSGDLSVFNYDPNVIGGGNLNVSELQDALDSSVVIDGLVTISSANNTVEDAIEGVTLQLNKADDGVVYQLDVTINKDVVRSAVSNFVESFNALRGKISNLTAYNPETGVSGLLQGDSTTVGLANRLRRELSATVEGVSANVDTLAEIGITTNVDDGTLELDTDALSAALDSNFDDFSTLFNGDNGFAVRLDTIADVYTEFDGLLDNRTNGLKSQIDRIGEQREALNRRIAVIQQRFLQQFTALDTLLGQLNSTSNFLSQQLQNLPKPGGSNS